MSLIAREESMTWLGCKCCCSIMRITKILATHGNQNFFPISISILTRADTTGQYVYVCIDSKIQFRNVDDRQNSSRISPNEACKHSKY